MNRHTFTITIDIDEEVLADHIDSGRERPPYDADPGQWDGSDIFAAVEEGIVDPQETVLVSYQPGTADGS